MDKPRSPEPGSGHWGPSIGYLVIALGLVAGALVGWWTSMSASPDAAAPASAASTAASGAPAVAPVRVAAAASGPASVVPVPTASTASGARIARVRPSGGDQTPDITDFINDGEKPTMTEVIARLHAAGVHTGLGAFQPPGTRPPLIGLAVPEDFALPPGYVRHYQATDDGQRIEPILMFAPGWQAVGPDGRPVAMPADRVVPPELAPPGLPLRRIVVPAPAEGP